MAFEDPGWSRQHGDRRACQSCSSAKAKCTFSDTSAPSQSGKSDCERCLRLKKLCVPQNSGVKKNKKPASTAARGAQLEQKLENIEKLLASKQDQLATQDSSTPPAANADTPLDSSSSLNLGDSNPAAANYANTPYSSSQDVSKVVNPSGSNSLLSPDEVVKLVESWRPVIVQEFPFVALLPDESTVDLVRKGPFLTKSVAVAALWGDFSRQVALAQELIKEISLEMLVFGRKNLDLLQGILVLLGWYHFHVLINPQTTNLLYLMSALVVDLNLNRTIDHLASTKRTDLWAIRHKIPPAIRGLIRPSTAERRALLGCYYMQSIISIIYRKIDPMAYSAQVEDACKELDQAGESQSDKLLVRLVQGQRMRERLGQGLKISIPDFGSEESLDPFVMFVEACQVELNSQKQDWPAELQSNSKLLLLHFSAKVDLYEMAFHKLGRKPSQVGDSAPDAIDTNGGQCARSLDILSKCLYAIRDFTNVLNQTPIPQFHHPTSDTWARTGHIFLVLARLSQSPFLTSTTPFSPQIRALLNLNETLETQSSRWEEASALARSQGLPLGDNHLFVRWAKRTRAFKVTSQEYDLDADLRDAFKLASFPGHDPVPSSQPFDASAGINREVSRRFPGSREQGEIDEDVDVIMGQPGEDEGMDVTGQPNAADAAVGMMGMDRETYESLISLQQEQDPWGWDANLLAPQQCPVS